MNIADMSNDDEVGDFRLPLFTPTKMMRTSSVIVIKGNGKITLPF